MKLSRKLSEELPRPIRENMTEAELINSVSRGRGGGERQEDE